MDSRTTRVIIARFYVAKGLQINPIKAIKFILTNREYFQDMKDETIQEIMKEQNITQEQVDKETVVTFDSMYAEIQEFDKMKKDAEELHAKRKEDYKKRDFGHGVKSRHEPSIPNNIYVPLSEKKENSSSEKKEVVSSENSSSEKIKENIQENKE